MCWDDMTKIMTAPKRALLKSRICDNEKVERVSQFLNLLLAKCGRCKRQGSRFEVFLSEVRKRMCYHTHEYLEAKAKWKILFSTEFQ